MGIIRRAARSTAPTRRIGATANESPLMDPTEVTNVDRDVVDCDGGEGPLGHPVVYLNLGDDGRIDCPYCGRRFVLARQPGAESRAS